jgi:hypothetical protein
VAIGEEPTPVDERTGLMPLSVITYYEEPWFDIAMGKNLHHYFHPRNHVLLQDIGGQALRHCRLQAVQPELHNIGPNCYHSFYAGPPIPSDKAKQFAAVILAFAGYIPEQGIDFSGSSPRVVDLDHKQLADLRVMSERANFIHYKNFKFRHSAVRLFMQDYVLGQKIPEDKKLKATIENFLTTKDVKKRQWLGFLILSKVIETATDPICEQYAEIYRTGLLIPSAPKEPYKIVKNRLALCGHRDDIFAKLAAKCWPLLDVEVA